MKPALALLVLAVTLAGAGDAMAQDLAALEAELKLLEQKEAALEAGDLRSANELQVASNAFQQKLLASPAKGTPEWRAVAQRAVELGNRITAKQRAPGAEGAADSATRAGAAILDEVEMGLEVMKPADTAEANRLVALLNKAAETLGGASRGARSSDLFKASAARLKDLNARVRARHAEPVEAAPAGGSSADGLDLAIEPAGFASTELYYWKEFVAWYRDSLAGLRAGDLRRDPKTIEDKLARVPASERTAPAVAEARALIAKYRARRDVLLAEAAGRAADQRAKDQAEYEEVNRILGELQGYFDRDFTVKLEPPCDPASIRAWIGRLTEAEALRVKGEAMMARVKTEFPRYAEDPLVKRLTVFFAQSMRERMARDIEHSVGRIVDGPSSQNGLLRARLEHASRFLEPDAFNDQRRANDGWVNDAFQTITEGIEACEALRIFRTEYEKKEADPAVDALAASLRAALVREEGAAVAVYEKARMPAGLSSGPDFDAARAAVLAYGTPADVIARIVVSHGPVSYETRRSSTSDAGSDWIRIESWTERGRKMQATVAEKTNGDMRMVVYDLKFIEVGHPDSPRGRWFCSGRFETRRIKPENVMLD
ncbi:MAG: hypothetical protein MUE73_08710 [Planctomycetes bacterium]|jgi:hypothetical protein|nr:hypothetical protein [Planctomycetota bacterium]